MREIKFRGKRLDNGEWVYGYYVYYGFTDNQKHYIVPDYASALYAFEVDPSTVGQFTCIEDKNGRGIYEGDIVRFTDRRHNGQDIHYIGVVKYITHSCWFAIEYRNLAGDIAYLNINILPTEIIGHICENPELLKE